MTEAGVHTYPCVCGTTHRPSAYVQAHWHERHTHQCAVCWRQNEIRSGRVVNSVVLQRWTIPYKPER